LLAFAAFPCILSVFDLLENHCLYAFLAFSASPIYAEILNKWEKIEPKKVLGDDFRSVGFLS